MGLGRQIIEALARENAYKPLRGTALLIGRQTVYFTRAEILSFLPEHGLSVADIDPASIELDGSTIDRKADHLGRELISDVALLKLLGAEKVLALDHSAYEHADIVHDLRYPIPLELHGKADTLVDGSTLDNVFTPSVVLQNYAKLLKPGGRLFTVNAFSGHDTAYAIMPPLWYIDYFVMNGFADCHAYVLVFSEGLQNTFYVSLSEIERLGREMGRFRSPYHMVTVVFAEKGAASTEDCLPNQQDYRSPEDWATYRTNLSVMLASRRPHLARSTAAQFFIDIERGHHYVDTEFVEHDLPVTG
jgi:hypothetical protein